MCIKDVHRNSAPDACPETSVRFCFGGKLSVYFSRFRKCFGIVGVFAKQIVILDIGYGFVVLNSIW